MSKHVSLGAEMLWTILCEVKMRIPVKFLLKINKDNKHVGCVSLWVSLDKLNN